MNTLTLDNVKWLAQAARGQIDTIYHHWTAGRYNQFFDDYHLSINGDGEIRSAITYLTDYRSATYRRNTGSVAIALECALGAMSENDLGQYPPTDKQIEVLAQVTAVLCNELELPIDIQHVMTHAEAADNKDGRYPHAPYGADSTCERWDLLVVKEGDPRWSGGYVLRGKAKWYLNEIK